MNTLLDSPKYKSFTKERNQALEQINLNTQLDVSRMLHTVLENITGNVSMMALTKDMSLSQMQSLSNQLKYFLDHQFSALIPEVVARIRRARKNTFVLTYFAELEAIARATQKTKKIPLHEFKAKLHKQMDASTLNGHKLMNRVWLAMNDLMRDILKAFQKSVMKELPPVEIVQAIQAVYPPMIEYRKPPRALKPIREADSKDGKEFDFYHDLTNDSDWEQAVQAYKDTELPASRFDSTPGFDSESGYMRYSWELEQDMTDDFVQQVRDGQVDAANDLGVKEFVWVAIIDKKTCEVCCLPRAGKTTSEIEAMLSSGELDKEACDAVTPPAHPWCRCDVAPVASTDQVEGPDWKSFGDWLES